VFGTIKTCFDSELELFELIGALNMIRGLLLPRLAVLRPFKKVFPLLMVVIFMLAEFTCETGLMLIFEVVGPSNVVVVVVVVPPVVVICGLDELTWMEERDINWLFDVS
jgi:hypothetical protein